MTTSARLMAPATSGDIKVVSFHCAHLDTLYAEPIPTRELKTSPMLARETERQPEKLPEKWEQNQ